MGATCPICRLYGQVTADVRGGAEEISAKALSVGLSNAYFKSLGLPTLIDGY